MEIRVWQENKIGKSEKNKIITFLFCSGTLFLDQNLRYKNTKRTDSNYCDFTLDKVWR